MLINAILLGHSQAKAMLTTGASQGFVKGVLGRAVTHVSSPLVVLPGGERLHPPGPHLQAVPQEHHRKGRSQHQEGEEPKMGSTSPSSILHVLRLTRAVRLISFRSVRKLTPKSTCLPRTATLR